MVRDDVEGTNVVVAVAVEAGVDAARTRVEAATDTEGLKTAVLLLLPLLLLLLLLLLILPRFLLALPLSLQDLTKERADAIVLLECLGSGEDRTSTSESSSLRFFPFLGLLQLPSLVVAAAARFTPLLELAVAGDSIPAPGL